MERMWSGDQKIPGVWIRQGEEYFRKQGVATSVDCGRDRGGGDWGNERSQVNCKSGDAGTEVLETVGRKQDGSQEPSWKGRMDWSWDLGMEVGMQLSKELAGGGVGGGTGRILVPLEACFCLCHFSQEHSPHSRLLLASLHPLRIV